MSTTAPLALMLAGGTGGHVYPALAVALKLRERGFRLRWIGTSRGLEARVVGAEDIPLHELPMRGLRGKGFVQTCVGVVLLGVSTFIALGLMLRYRPAVVIGMGGYASFPAAIAAWLVRRPLMLQEQNAVAGSANRTLARFASVIATGFPGVLGRYAVTRYLGNPVRDDLLQVTSVISEPQPEATLRVLVLGGSLGALPLNSVIPGVAAALQGRCEWRHQCGPEHEGSTRSAYEEAGVTTWSVHPFVEDMAAVYAWADLVICRAGALTVAELAVTGRPSILVPLPYAIDDHQSANARFLSESGAAILLPQEELSDRLEGEIEKLLQDRSRLMSMSAAALRQGRPEATNAIADCAQELAA